MSHEGLISSMRGWRGPQASSLEEYFEKVGREAWGQLRGVARQNPHYIDDLALEFAVGRIEESHGAVFALLLDIAAKDPERRPRMMASYRDLMSVYPKEALGPAGYNLHEYHYLLDMEWIAAARAYHDFDPDGAWGILEAAAMYEPEFVLPATVDWFEGKRASMPRDYFVVMFSLAGHWPEHRDDYLARLLRHFDEHPAAAVEGTAFTARDDKNLITRDVVAAMLVHFTSNNEKAWEFFEAAVKARPEIYDDALLDALSIHVSTGPAKLLGIIRHLMEKEDPRLPRLMDRFVSIVRRHPAEGIDKVRYAFQREDIRLVRHDLVKAICEGFSAAPYPAYEFLWHCVEDRPELIGPPEVEAALANIPHATNRAFGFFRELLKLRPEFTRECTLALFEALAQEPVNRAFVREEEMSEIIAISEAAHIKTGLENALREPPRVGSRRARALMAIMFRTKLRARRQVLLEALRYAANVVLWRKIPSQDGGKEESEKFSPIWDFIMFIIDNSGDDAISTAAAERFVEGAFQLHYLCRTGAEHDEFLRKLDTGYPPRHPFPPLAEFLEADTELAHLYRLVLELGRRFKAEPRINPLHDFSSRLQSAEIELSAIDNELTRAMGARRVKLQERHATLNRQVAIWINPTYAKAFTDPEAEKRLTEPARALLKREKKDLAKHLRDSLRAEAIRIAVAAVDASRVDLYRKRLHDVLGRDIDIATVEPRILPSFLWFQAIGNMQANTKYLKRMIEDRIAGRPHDWLRTEPAVLKWAERVKAKWPDVKIDRWRAPFTKDVQYRPKDALAEKKRRMKADLAQARVMLEKAGVKGIASESYEELYAKLQELRISPPAEEKPEEEKPGEKPPAPPTPRPAVDPDLLSEIGMNLERVRFAEQTPESDFEGRITLTVETDPFEILFMGEYGFASCLSLRGSNAWSAVSNAVDIDKAIVWAKEPGGNVVGRRLLALTPNGVLMFRTYTNRHGLALDRAFDEFVAEYAAHCGTAVTHGGHPGALLSDRWYDDGAM